MSLPFCVGAAIANKGLSIRNFTADGLSDDLALKLAQKVVTEDISYGEVTSFFPPGKVTIKLKSGDAYTRQIDFPFGHPRNPMSPQDVVNKFKDCALHSRSQKEPAHIIRMINELETVQDIRIVTESFQ